MGFIGTVGAVAVGVAIGPYLVRIVGFIILISLFTIAFCSPDHPVYESNVRQVVPGVDRILVGTRGDEVRLPE